MLRYVRCRDRIHEVNDSARDDSIARATVLQSNCKYCESSARHLALSVRNARIAAERSTSIRETCDLPKLTFDPPGEQYCSCIFMQLFLQKMSTSKLWAIRWWLDCLNRESRLGQTSHTDCRTQTQTG